MNGLFRHLPNLLTGMRLLSAPALALLLAMGADRAALGIFAFAGLSDAADGYLAKRFGFTTRFGRYLDPAADKLLMLAAFVALSAVGFSPLWLAGIVIGRDVAIVTGVLLGHLLELPLRIAPLLIGKLTTAVQVAYVGMSLFLPAFGLRWPVVAYDAAVATASITVVSGLAYGGVWLRAFATRHVRAN